VAASTEVSTTRRAPSNETTRPTSRTMPVNTFEPYPEDGGGARLVAGSADA
jgi:hypothetical protein